METTSILIAESHENTLHALLAFLSLEPAFSIVGTATTGKELITKANQLNPDICILNMDLQGIDVFQLQQNPQFQGLNTDFIAITDRCEPSLKKRIIASGIKACLINPFDVGELLYAVTKVANGEDYFAQPFSRVNATKNL